jgi:hypothetical protein
MKTEFGTSWIWIVFWNTLLKEMVKERWKGWEDKEKGVMSVCWITLKKSCCILKEETLDRTLWRTGSGIGYESVLNYSFYSLIN